MISKEFFERYELQDLRSIYKKIAIVTGDYCPDSFRNWCINKIVNIYNSNLDKVIKVFEQENLGDLPNIKLYFLGEEYLGKEKKRHEIEIILKSWGIYNKEIGIEPTIKEVLFNRYRGEIIKKVVGQKESSQYPIYLKMILFIWEVYNNIQPTEDVIYNRNEQKVFLEFLKENNFIDVKRPQGKWDSKSNKRYYSLKNFDIEEIFNNENKLIELIIKFYQNIFLKINYTSFIKDLGKIKLIQQNEDEWVDISKIKIIRDDKIKLLEAKDLIKIFEINDQRLVQLTNVAEALIEKRLIEKWNGQALYFIDSEKEIIALNDNPIKITSRLVNKKIIQKDILLIFQNQ